MIRVRVCNLDGTEFDTYDFCDAEEAFDFMMFCNEKDDYYAIIEEDEFDE